MRREDEAVSKGEGEKESDVHGGGEQYSPISSSVMLMARVARDAELDFNPSSSNSLNPTLQGLQVDRRPLNQLLELCISEPLITSTVELLVPSLQAAWADDRQSSIGGGDRGLEGEVGSGLDESTAWKD